MKIDILAFGAHPDDVELSCAGTLLKYQSQGKSIGIVDLTKGELGTRGTEETRREEAAAASEILGVSVRENLDLGDGWFEVNRSNIEKTIGAIRKYRPSVVLANAVRERHPDHERGAKLLIEACFLSGLRKIETFSDGVAQEPWRPKQLFHYIQYYHSTPDFIVDISEFQSKKLESILAYKTQFFDPDSSEPKTMISSQGFLDFIDARGREMGSAIGVKYGEGFTSETPISYDLNTLL